MSDTTTTEEEAKAEALRLVPPVADSVTQASLEQRYADLRERVEAVEQREAGEPDLATMVSEWVPTKKVMLATPSNRGLSTQFVASMLNTMADARMLADKIQIQPYIWPGESLISRARNDILRYFYEESDCTHLFFVDDDIAWDPVCFFDLLAADKDIVGGIYPLKVLRWDKLVGITIENEQHAKALTLEVVVNGIKADHPDNDGELMVAHDLGTGFMCISREAIRKMTEVYPDDWYASNARNQDRRKTWDFFGLTYDGTKGTMDSTLLSEDYAFCRKAQAAGINTYVHTGIPLLVHIGQHAYGRME